MKNAATLCCIAAVALLWEPGSTEARTLVDELASLSWEKKMQIVEGEKYKDMLQRHIRRAIDSGRGIDERDGDGRTALHWAAANGHQDQVEELLQAGADVNSSCQYVGQTPLFMAARWGREDAVRVLLQHGADPKKSDKFGKNALDAALAAGSPHMHNVLQSAVAS